MATTETVKLGIVHIPEGRRLFPYLTVLSNLKLGARTVGYCREKGVKLVGKSL
jgi:ABC-type branched-subunit amino acid transport system ATPase component